MYIVYMHTHTIIIISYFIVTYLFDVFTYYLSEVQICQSKTEAFAVRPGTFRSMLRC